MATMTPGRLINLAAAVLGAIGTIILFSTSWSLQPLGGAQLGSDQLVKDNEGIRAKNAARALWQRVGLGLILASFVMQGVAQFFD